MFSNTEIAKQFRQWVLDILDNEIQKTTPPPATLPVPAPVESTDVKIETVNSEITSIENLTDDELIYCWSKIGVCRVYF